MLIRADREIGTYLKYAFELMQYRELPREISFTLKAGRGSLDYQEASKIKELLPRTNISLVKMEDIAKACMGIWGMPKFFDECRLSEELCRENNICRVDREPCTPFPIKNIPNLNVGFLKRAAEDRAREALRLAEEGSLNQAPSFSLSEAQAMPMQEREDYRWHGGPRGTGISSIRW